MSGELIVQRDTAYGRAARGAFVPRATLTAAVRRMPAVVRRPLFEDMGESPHEETSPDDFQRSRKAPATFQGAQPAELTPTMLRSITVSRPGIRG